MAIYLQSGKSIDIGSDDVPEKYCEVCFEMHDTVKPVAGYCQNCDQDLCVDCFSKHLMRKPFRNHKLVDKSTRDEAHQPKSQKFGEDCHKHQGESLMSYCHDHSEFICNVCLTIDHQACNAEEISKLARNIHDSPDLQNLNEILSIFKKGFSEHLNKATLYKTSGTKNHSDAINEMKTIRDEFDTLMAETESLADKVKEEDLQKIEKLSATCDVVIDQINKIVTHIETLKEESDAESLFFSVKRAESQLKSLEDNLNKLDKDNTTREYTFEPDEKLKSLFNDLTMLGHLSFETSEHTVVPHPFKTISLSDQKAKKPKFLKDIKVKSTTDKLFTVRGSLLLSNNEILISDYNNQKLKLINTDHDNITSEIQCSGNPMDLTNFKDGEFAVTVENPSTIQLVSVSQHSLSKGKEIPVNGKCRGIAYNEKNETLIVTYKEPSKVEIINLSGSVLKCLDKDSKGGQIFAMPGHVSLSPDRTAMYVSDYDNSTVTSMAIYGDVKAVYGDEHLIEGPRGLCVHSSGLVYVVGGYSNTVHQLDPVSGELKLLLNEKDGLHYPYSISYCELEDKLYIGMWNASDLKVFEMK